MSASWTGLGALGHQVRNMHFAKGSLTENFHYNGYFRDASATASVNGIDMGTPLYADMFNVKRAYVVICHMC